MAFSFYLFDIWEHLISFFSNHFILSGFFSRNHSYRLSLRNICYRRRRTKQDIPISYRAICFLC
jgi:hypothetical protein